ncbi:unnamed protein product [Parnassius apollo]|uniref:(apollo) hypothetical protein n=1 Tax=Parnassius apollo TaxID=110799 RepID=A0A8S3XQR7_PARAO|nr:unnamed protein product [Parnassius apollo]
MNSRSKRMLALMKNYDKGTDVDQRILVNNNNGIEKSEEQSTHITENDIQEPPVIYHQDETIAADSVPEQNEDPFMPVGEMTPISAIDFPPSETSQVHSNIRSPTPLTSIFNALPSPLTENIDGSSQVSLPNTPVASPVNRYAKCDDPFCCQHETGDFSCPSVSTIGTNSNQPSPSCSTFLKKQREKAHSKI